MVSQAVQACGARESLLPFPIQDNFAENERWTTNLVWRVNPASAVGGLLRRRDPPRQGPKLRSRVFKSKKVVKSRGGGSPSKGATVSSVRRTVSEKLNFHSLFGLG